MRDTGCQYQLFSNSNEMQKFGEMGGKRSRGKEKDNHRRRDPVGVNAERGGYAEKSEE
jgi:hypothetical protein